MNLPNKITTLRMILVIFIATLLLLPIEWFDVIGGINVSVNFFIAWILFIVASLSDFLDGYIARKYNMVTDYGKFMDPIADKLLVNTLFIILAVWGEVPAVCTVIFIARDTIVDAIRMIAVEKQKVIAASKLGKLKTVTQMVAIILVLLQIDKFVFPVATIFVYIAALCSLISGVDYFVKNHKIVLEGAYYNGENN